ncbi:hypothetical protein N2152v2_007580 [Parachlorella kessleri]
MPRVKRGNVIDLTGEDSEEAGPSSRPTQAAAVEASGVGPPEGKRKGKKRRISAATEAVDDERGKKQGKKGKPEKRVDAAGRTVRYASAPPSNPRSASHELCQVRPPGSGHRLFLIDRKLLSPVGSEEGAAEEFAVLGATGNVYTVTICRQPQCTCPDYLKGNLCKHILFVMLRVLRLPTDEPLVWQRALLTDEVNAVLSGEKSEGPAEVQRGVLAADAVRAQYRRLSSQGGSGSGEEHASGNQRPVEGDCPICFESLSAQGMGDNKVTFCAGSCGNNVHVGCMRMWLGSHHTTCPLCRAPWVDGLNPGAGAAGEPKEYPNLAQYSRAHQRANTSVEALYGDRQAANMWRSMQGGY